MPKNAPSLAQFFENFDRITNDRDKTHFERQKAYFDALIEFKNNGGTFNEARQFPEFSVALYIYDRAGYLGLMIYGNIGGTYNPEYRGQYGKNELMEMLSGNYKVDRKMLLECFIEGKGVFCSDHLDNAGTSELFCLLEPIFDKDKACELLTFYLENGGHLNARAKTIYSQNELCTIVEHCGMKGLEIYFEYGGEFNPSFNSPEGNAEMAIICRELGAEGLKFFKDNGGVFSTQAQDGTLTPAMHIAFSKDVKALQYFAENGGQFFPDIKNRKDWNEAMLIAEFIGAEGLEIFMKHGGKFKPDNFVIFNDKNYTEKEAFEKAFNGAIPEYFYSQPQIQGKAKAAPKPKQ